MIEYKNKYGDLTLELTGNLIHVSDVHSKDLDDKYFFTLDTAEKIALITENEKIQMAFSMDKIDKKQTDKIAYLFYHETTSTGYITMLKEINFVSKVNPAEEIERLNRLQPPYFL